MKIALTLLSIISLQTLSQAQTEISREEVATLKSYDLAEVEKQGHTLEGKIIRLKFNYRDSATEKAEGGGIEGTLRIWKYSTAAAGSDYKYGSVAVKVPPEGVAWFMKLPVKESRSSLTVVAKITSAGTFIKADLLGREIKTDLKGSKIVW